MLQQSPPASVEIGAQEQVLQWGIQINTGPDSPVRSAQVVLPMDYPYSAPVLRLCNAQRVPSDVPFEPHHKWTPYSCVGTLIEELRDAISVYN